MAKRSLCLLLAVLTLFTLASPALAAESDISSGTCGAQGDNVTWKVTGTWDKASAPDPSDWVLTISGKGDMADYDLAVGLSPWFGGYDIQCMMPKVVVAEGVTSIGDCTFFQTKNITSITLPGTLKRIGVNAFYSCENLASVTIPSSVESIGGSAFYGCGSLTSATIPSSVKTIGDHAFDACAALKSITVLNPDCAIENATASDKEGTALGVPGTTVVSGYDGSTAEAYANEYGYTFESLGKAPDTSKPSQLAAPTVTISNASNGIKVSWNKITGSPRYMVYYRENGGGWKKIGTTTATTYTRKAKDLKNGVTYTFTVRCCANDKKTMLSGYTASNSLKYTAAGATQLTAPTVTISKASNGIKVSWNKISGAPRYMVYYKENGGGWKKIGTTTATTYTRKAANLKNGATYEFTVRCCANDKKTMLSGYTASNSLKYSNQLTAPTVTISKASNGIQVSWNKVDGAPRYMVYYRENGGGWKKIGTTTATTYTRKAANLKNGVTYEFTVRCCANDKKTMLSGYTASNSLTYSVPSAQPAAPGGSGTYVLNTNSMKFHRPSCASAAKISAANRQDVTTDRNTLIAQGYEPCKVCKP